MLSPVRFSLMTLLLISSLMSYAFAGDDHHRGHHRQHHNGHHAKHYVAPAHRGHHHHRGYVERRPQYVRETYYRPRHYHQHDRHCGHYVSSRERVYVQESSYYRHTTPIRYEPIHYDSVGFHVDGLTIHLH